MNNSYRLNKSKQKKRYKLEPSLPELTNWLEKDESQRKIKYLH